MCHSYAVEVGLGKVESAHVVPRLEVIADQIVVGSFAPLEVMLDVVKMVLVAPLEVDEVGLLMCLQLEKPLAMKL